MSERPPSLHRLPGIDVARALALFGMFAAHLLTRTARDGAPNPWFPLVAGHPSALFALLAGVGIVLASRKYSRTRAAVAAIAVRGILLVVLGLVLGVVDAPAVVILVVYGTMFVLLAPLVRAPSTILGALALLAVAGASLLSFGLRAEFVPGLSGELPNPGPSTLFLHPLELVRSTFLTGYYPVLTWLPYPLVGMLVGRRLVAARRAPRDDSGGTSALARTAIGLMVAGGALFALARGADALALSRIGGVTVLARGLDQDAADTRDQLVNGLSGTTPTADARWLLLASPHSGSTGDLLGTIGVALVVTGACVLLCLTRSVAVALGPLRGAGSSTLTLYSFHIMTLGLLGASPLALPFYVVVGLAYGLLLINLPQRGPLESVVSDASLLADRAVDTPEAAHVE